MLPPAGCLRQVNRRGLQVAGHRSTGIAACAARGRSADVPLRALT